MFTEWHWVTPEEAAKQEEYARQEREASLKRWPMSQRRDRCLNCGAFMRKHSYEHTKCKNCGYSYLDLQ